MNRRAPLVLAALVFGTPAACDRRPLAGPPDLRTGRDECAECGMLINDERFAAGALIDDRGRRAHRVFDDIGCLMDWERDGSAPIIDRFVRDADGSGWLNARDAVILFAEASALRTPMGTGIGAYATAAAADAARARHGGQALTFADAAAKRAAWMRHRFGPSSPDR